MIDKQEKQTGETLMIQLKDMQPHPLLNRVGLLPGLIERETKLGKAQGKSRNEHQARAEELGAEFDALAESIAAHGIRERVKVVRTASGWLIVDGRHRWEASKQVAAHAYKDAAKEKMSKEIQANGIPCEEVKEADAPGIIMDAMNRRHLTKGARAYLAVLINPEVADGGKGARKDLTSALSAEVLAANTGVSVRLVEEAIGLFRKFSEREDLRKRFEDGIWIGEGLASIKAGVAGFLETGKTDNSKESKADKATRLANQWVDTGIGNFNKVERFWKEFERFTPDQAETVTASAVEAFEKAPDEVRSAIIASYEKSNS